MKYSKHGLGVGSGAVLLALWVPACGGTTTGPGPGTDPGTSAGSAGPISIAQLADQLANAFCDNIGGCCQAAAIAFDLASCKANILSTVSQGLAREMSPNIRYDANAAGACVAAYASGVKSCKPSNSIDTACSRVFVGSLPAGAPCSLDDECARPTGGTAFCDGGDSTNGGPSGTCSAASASATSAHGKLGESCAASCPSGDTCTVTSAGGGTGTPSPAMSVCYSDDGLYCSVDTTCQPLIAVGQPCSFDGCVNGAFCGAGVCTAGKADGAACGIDSECAGGSCLSSGAPSAGTGASPGVTGTCGGRGIASVASCAGDLG
jgi:hypothetical protein